jgi:membrane carboxypeptidase/penicillin-binding protein
MKAQALSFDIIISAIGFSILLIAIFFWFNMLNTEDLREYEELKLIGVSVVETLFSEDVLFSIKNKNDSDIRIIIQSINISTNVSLFIIVNDTNYIARHGIDCSNIPNVKNIIKFNRIYNNKTYTIYVCR